MIPRAFLLLTVFLPLAVGQAQTQPPTTDKKAAMNQMLDALKYAPNEEAAAMLEARLRRMQIEAGSPTVTLLMSRGIRDLSAGQHDDAIETFGAALVLDPDLAEAYHQRAKARYAAGDTRGAIRDIQETLKREPRSFAALRTLTEIATEREDWKSAYAAWEQLMQIDPKTPNGEERLKELRRRAVGPDA